MSGLGNKHLKIQLPHKYSCEHLHPPQVAETLPCIAAMGIELRPSTSQKQMSAQSHFSLDERLVGQGKREDREPNTAGAEEPQGAIGMEPCHGGTISSVSVSGGRGVFEIPVLFQVCFQLPVPNSSSSSASFAAPGFCSCSRVSPNSPSERIN